MKKLYYAFTLLLFTFFTLIQLNGQTLCARIAANVYSTDPQSGSYGVAVTLDQTYDQNITVNGIIYQDGQHHIDGWQITVPAGSLTAVLQDYYVAQPPAVVSIETSSVSPSTVTKNGVTYGTQGFSGNCIGDIFVNGNRFNFTSIASYEQFADNVFNRNVLTNVATGNSDLTTLEEIGNEQDTLNPEFIKQILNQDLIMEVSSYLIKIDLPNSRALVIQNFKPNGYESLVNNNLSADGMMEFSTDVGNAIEILQMIENGTLTTSNYQSAIETSTSYLKFSGSSSEYLASSEPLSELGVVRGGPSAENNQNFLNQVQVPMSCGHAASGENKQKRGWDTGTGSSGCPDNIIVYIMDNKVVYQRAVFYFSLQSKIKSVWGGTCGNLVLFPSYDASLKLEGTAKYSKRCGAEQFPTRLDFHNGRELNWRAYESSRSLSKYDFTVTFGIKHQGSSGNYVSSGPMRIVSGY